MPKYRKAIRDARGRVAVFLQMSYLGLKSKGWRPGLPADHAEYCQRLDALEEPEIQRKNPVSNIAETPQECSAVWKALEPVEKGYRANAKVQFRVVGNLPYTFTPEQRRAVMEDFGELAFGRYGLGYMAFCHLPDENGDERNFHFHLLATTRPVVRVGDHEWAIGEEKLTELFTPEGMKRIRAIYAAVLNRHCRKNGMDERFTHQNYQERGIDAFRTEKIGPARIAAFEAGENVAVVERNRSRIVGNEAAVEAQLLHRKFLLQKRLATSICRVADMAKMAKRIGGLRNQIRMIGEAVEAVQTTTKSPQSKMKNRLAEVVRIILQSAEQSKAQQRFPLNSGFRNATIQLASRASSIASRKWARRRNGVDLHHVRKMVLDIAASADRSKSTSAIPAARTVILSPQSRLSSIAKAAAKARAVREGIDRQLILAVGVHERIDGIVSQVGNARISNRSTVPRRLGSNAREVFERAIDVSIDPPISSARPKKTFECERLDEIGLKARRLAAIKRSSRFEPSVMGNVKSVLNKTQLEAIGSASLQPSDVAASRTYIMQVIHDLGALSESGKPSTESAETAPLEHESHIEGDRNCAADGLERTSTDFASEPAAAPLNDRIAEFAEAMQHKPTGLCLWEDGSVHPVSAISSSWGVSKIDLGSALAKRKLLPLYVEQELRFERLERELKYLAVGEEELDETWLRTATDLSSDAAKTLEIYSRSQLLWGALDRVRRELWLDENIASRTRQMTEQGIDWRAIENADPALCAPPNGFVTGAKPSAASASASHEQGRHAAMLHDRGRDV